MKKVSLITRFEPEDGPVVMGEQTRHLLPGVAAPSQQLAATPAAAPPQSVALASYAEHSIMDAPSGPHTSAIQSISSGSLPSAGWAGARGGVPTGVQPQSPNAPLSQMSAMTIRLPRRLGTTRTSAQHSALQPTPQNLPFGEPASAGGRPATDVPAQSAAAASTAPPQAPSHQASTPPRPQTQSLRNSLLSTLPARVVPAAQPAHAGAR
jgi:hypothetical protein